MGVDNKKYTKIILNYLEIINIKDYSQQMDKK